MLPNGNQTRSKGSILYENTTAYDAFAYIILCRMLDSKSFKSSFMEMSNSTITEFFNNYIENAKEATILRSRNNVLSNFFQVSVVDKIKTMNCASTVYEIGKLIWPSSAVEKNEMKMKLYLTLSQT